VFDKHFTCGGRERLKLPNQCETKDVFCKVLNMAKSVGYDVPDIYDKYNEYKEQTCLQFVYKCDLVYWDNIKYFEEEAKIEYGHIEQMPYASAKLLFEHELKEYV
jgi:hypothetical protein